MYLNKLCLIAATNSKTKNNETLDYIDLAVIAAKRVKRYLDIPVFLLTSDTNVRENEVFDKILIISKSITSNRKMLAGSDHIEYDWHNDLRINAYELTKTYADKILMIDADYMVASDQLNAWLDCDSNFQIFDKVIDVTGRSLYKNYFPSNDILQRWATVMCWQPSDEASIIFKTAQMVRDNYEFYSLMLGMPAKPYRNDLAFSVACHLHNVPQSSLSLFNLPPDSFLFVKQSYPDAWMIQHQHHVNFWSGDLHVMNKSYAIDFSLRNELNIQDVKT